MKVLLTLFTLTLLISNVEKQSAKALPDGKYLVELDKQYKDNGLNEFEFTLQNEKFTLKNADKIKDFDIVWIDQNAFVVKGYTEPLNPTELEKEIVKDTQVCFRIIKNEKNKYFFTLSDELNNFSIYSGVFVKVE